MLSKISPGRTSQYLVSNDQLKILIFLGNIYSLKALRVHSVCYVHCGIVRVGCRTGCWEQNVHIVHRHHTGRCWWREIQSAWFLQLHFPASRTLGHNQFSSLLFISCYIKCLQLHHNFEIGEYQAINSFNWQLTSSYEAQSYDES